MAIDNTEQVCTIVLDCTLNHDTSQNALILVLHPRMKMAIRGSYEQ